MCTFCPVLSNQKAFSLIKEKSISLSGLVFDYLFWQQPQLCEEYHKCQHIDQYFVQWSGHWKGGVPKKACSFTLLLLVSLSPTCPRSFLVRILYRLFTWVFLVKFNSSTTIHHTWFLVQLLKILSLGGFPIFKESDSVSYDFLVITVMGKDPNFLLLQTFIHKPFHAKAQHMAFLKW